MKKQFKEVWVDEIPEAKKRQYILNQEGNKAIKVPDNAFKAFEKIRTSDERTRHFLHNLLAITILNRKSDLQVKKLLISLYFAPQFKEFFSDKEIDDLIEFIRFCPEGYDVKPLLWWASHEFGDPILTP